MFLSAKLEPQVGGSGRRQPDVRVSHDDVVMLLLLLLLEAINKFCLNDMG